MLVTIANLALALQVASPAPPPNADEPLVQEIQYRAYAHPPPCGHGWDLSARDGLCYPNGALAPQDQAARQYHRGPAYGGGRYPVPCGHGADLDIRDGLCYPNGTVPPRFQQGPQRYYGDDDHERRPRRRYY
jgi:hypothetical protein